MLQYSKTKEKLLEDIIIETGIYEILTRKSVLNRKQIEFYYCLQKFAENSLEQNIDYALETLAKDLYEKFNPDNKYSYKLKAKSKDLEFVKKFLTTIRKMYHTYSLEETINRVYSIVQQYITIKEITFEEIIGNEEAKRVLKKLIHVYRKYDPKKDENPILNYIEYPRSVLLYGPPGTGKTSLAKATISELRKNDLEIKEVFIDSQFKSKWFGESTKKLRELLTEAKSSGRINVVIFEDIDMLLTSRNEDNILVEKEILREIMHYFDAIPKNTLNIITSNDLAKIDPALIQRISQTEVYVPGPKTVEEYKKAIELHMKKGLENGIIKLNKKELYMIAEELKKFGFTGREIKDLSLRVYQNTIDDYGKIKTISFVHIKNIVTQLRKQSSKNWKDMRFL